MIKKTYKNTKKNTKKQIKRNTHKNNNKNNKTKKNNKIVKYKSRKIGYKPKKNEVIKVTSNEINNNDKLIWGNYGRVWSPKKQKFIYLGSKESIKVIVDDLKHTKEWKKRVNYLMNKYKKGFGDKLKKYIEEKNIKI